ncbi:hypothetical protein BDV97DRAFT_203848 [Delphinella strobiligena]|nr:hypothetical protein BDV97DRAFT_203848 [Delphinella strobiligena]
MLQARPDAPGRDMDISRFGYCLGSASEHVLFTLPYLTSRGLPVSHQVLSFSHTLMAQIAEDSQSVYLLGCFHNTSTDIKFVVCFELLQLYCFQCLEHRGSSTLDDETRSSQSCMTLWAKDNTHFHRRHSQNHRRHTLRSPGQISWSRRMLGNLSFGRSHALLHL